MRASTTCAVSNLVRAWGVSPQTKAHGTGKEKEPGRKPENSRQQPAAAGLGGAFPPATKHLMKASAALARSLNLVRLAGSQRGGAAKSPAPFRPPQAGRDCRNMSGNGNHINVGKKRGNHG